MILYFICGLMIEKLELDNAFPEWSLIWLIQIYQEKEPVIDLPSLFLLFHRQGGEVVQETITSSVSDDTCTLEFQRSDGTLITKLIDFKSVSILTFFIPHPGNPCHVAFTFWFGAIQIETMVLHPHRNRQVRWKSDTVPFLVEGRWRLFLRQQ